MSSIKEAFGTSTAVTITVASLADGNARESVAIDNSTNKFLDAMVSFKIKNGATGSDSCVYIWLYASEDGTNYDGPATGADAAITLTNANFKGPFVINMPTATTTYKAVLTSIASYFGGILPRKFGIVIENKSGAALSATAGDHAVAYTGIYQTVL